MQEVRTKSSLRGAKNQAQPQFSIPNITRRK